MKRLGLFLVLVLVLSAPALSILGGDPVVLSQGRLPDDARLGALKDLNGYFPFHPPATLAGWKARREEVRLQLLVSLGLWPAPSKTPMRPVIYGKINQGDYTVEKVYFESLPGFYVTGNLYRPVGRTGKRPGVLCPHGHWSGGRFTDNKDVRQEIARGAERFEDGGRSPLQARCVQLARMGCVVFHYDMIGYADSVQISQALAHGFSKQRSDMNDPVHWGFFSPQAESRLQSIMGLQTWDSIRSLDFLTGLPEVDPERIGVTGASGGGTQTFILCAVDPRPAAAFPAVMVSTAMQGGCTCENACLLRVGTGNVEIAGLFAPKPLGLTCAHDWTVEMPSKGFPELKRLYQLYGAEKKVRLTALTHFGHNYNSVSRSAMYSWFNRYLKLGYEDPILESDYSRLTRQELTVWDQKHPAPQGGKEFERKLLQYWNHDVQSQLRAARKSLKDFQEVYGKGIATVLGNTFDTAGHVEWTMTDKQDRGAYLEMSGLLRNTTYGEELPSVFLFPNGWNGRTVLWLDRKGKNGLFGAEGQVRPGVSRLIAHGDTVVGVDLIYQGEFLKDGMPLTHTRRVANPRESASYTFGYNRAVFAQRVHDVLSVLRFIHGHERKSKELILVGLNGMGPVGAAALAVARGVVDRAAIDTGGFRFAQVTEIHAPSFLPGGARYGDLPGMLAMGAPARLWLAGEKAVDPLLSRINRRRAVEPRIMLSEAQGTGTVKSAIKWLLRN